jgi:hypothetical protein
MLPDYLEPTRFMTREFLLRGDATMAAVVWAKAISQAAPILASVLQEDTLCASANNYEIQCQVS